MRRRRSFGHASRTDRFLNEDIANLNPGPGAKICSWDGCVGLSGNFYPEAFALRVNDIANLPTRSEYTNF